MLLLVHVTTEYLGWGSYSLQTFMHSRNTFEPLVEVQRYSILNIEICGWIVINLYVSLPHAPLESWAETWEWDHTQLGKPKVILILVCSKFFIWNNKFWTVKWTMNLNLVVCMLPWQLMTVFELLNNSGAIFSPLSSSRTILTLIGLCLMDFMWHNYLCRNKVYHVMCIQEASRGVWTIWHLTLCL